MQSEKTFIELLSKHQAVIYKVCNIYLDDWTDREDLFQEIALQAWKSFGSFKSNSQFSTWLYRVALNTAITFFKKEKKKATQTLPEEFIKEKAEECTKQ